MDTPVYMRYLYRRFEALDGRMVQKDVETLEALSQPGRLIINATGLGAARLLNDGDLYPIRGQVVRVELRRPTIFHR